MKELVEIQSLLKLKKFRDAGRYTFWNAMDIMEAGRPLANERGCVLICSDTILEIGGRIFCKATAMLINADDEVVKADGFAELNGYEEAPDMDAPQRTGTASSYARKYALNGLFALNDTKDSDDRAAVKYAKGGKGASTANAPTKQKTMTAEKYAQMVEMAANDESPEGYNSVREAYIAEYAPTGMQVATFEKDVSEYKRAHGMLPNFEGPAYQFPYMQGGNKGEKEMREEYAEKKTRAKGAKTLQGTIGREDGMFNNF